MSELFSSDNREVQTVLQGLLKTKVIGETAGNFGARLKDHNNITRAKLKLQWVNGYYLGMSSTTIVMRDESTL